MIRDVFDELDHPLIKCTECNDINYFNYLFRDEEGSESRCFLGFSVIHQNIRSYGRNIDEFLTVLHGLEHKFNCIILQGD